MAAPVCGMQTGTWIAARQDSIQDADFTAVIDMPTADFAIDNPGADWPQILVVDDDPDIVQLLARYLRGHGFRVVTAMNGAQLRTGIAAASIDLVLLDLGLPDEDGLALLRFLQTDWQVPVIVVSGRGEPVERVVGLELGADDYVTKPFDFRELLARIRTVLRRVLTPSTTAPTVVRLLEFDGLKLDLSARRLIDRAGNELALTTGEFELLQTLLQSPRQVLTRDQLMNRIHGHDAGPFDRAIDVQIGRLRRKIEVDPTSPRLITSVRGAGYLFAADVHKG
jgi:two-component system OmpR family response regulator